MNYWPWQAWQHEEEQPGATAFLGSSSHVQEWWESRSGPESPAHGGGGERILALEMKVATRDAQS